MKRFSYRPLKLYTKLTVISFGGKVHFLDEIDNSGGNRIQLDFSLEFYFIKFELNFHVMNNIWLFMSRVITVRPNSYWVSLSNLFLSDTTSNANNLTIKKESIADNSYLLSSNVSDSLAN